MRTDAVLVKIGAALIVVTALGNFQTYVSLILGQPWWVPTAIIALLFAVVLPVLVAFVFWRFPNTVVGSISASIDSEEGKGISANELLLIGVSLIGLYTLVFGIIDLVHTETMRVTFERHLRMMNISDTTISPDADAQRYAGLARIILGFVMLAGRHKIAGVLRAPRT